MAPKKKNHQPPRNELASCRPRLMDRWSWTISTRISDLWKGKHVHLWHVRFKTKLIERSEHYTIVAFKTKNRQKLQFQRLIIHKLDWIFLRCEKEVWTLPMWDAFPKSKTPPNSSRNQSYRSFSAILNDICLSENGLTSYKLRYPWTVSIFRAQINEVSAIFQ